VRAGVVVRKGVELQAACVAARKFVVVTGRTEMAVLLRGILAAGSGEDVLEHPSYDPDRLGLVLHVTNIPELAPCGLQGAVTGLVACLHELQDVVVDRAFAGCRVGAVEVGGGRLEDGVHRRDKSQSVSSQSMTER